MSSIPICPPLGAVVVYHRIQNGIIRECPGIPVDHDVVQPSLEEHPSFIKVHRIGGHRREMWNLRRNSHVGA